MDSTKYLIIGGGLAGARAAQSLVETAPDAKGATVILTTEAKLPYHRPPLSKGFLAGKESEEDILIHPQSFYDDNGIDVRFRQAARLIDPASKVCELELNKSIKYEKALVAIGISAKRWDSFGRSLEGVYYLRSVQDAIRLKNASSRMNEVVIVGSGFIGMEVAGFLAEKGIRVTLISKSGYLIPKLGNPEISEFLRAYYQKKRVKFIFDDAPYGFIGTGDVRAVHTKKGVKIPCDSVIVAIGSVWGQHLTDDSRFTLENGILVDEQLRTNLPDVWAAGDIANFPDPVFGYRRRIEHYDNADRQGTLAGKNMAGAAEKFSSVSMFFSDMFDLSWELYGDPEYSEQVIQRIEPSSRSACSVYVKNNRVNAIFVMGEAASESETAAKIVESRLSIEGKYDILRDSRRSLADLL